jgi:hypothetical protein
MNAKYILGAISAVFLILAISRIAGGSRVTEPKTKTWLTVGLIFGAVSAWLFFRS